MDIFEPRKSRSPPAALELGAKSASHAQRGITLLEALITLLVVTIGLLGVAALQVVGVQEGASALRHSQATWLAYEMADRMRANLNPASLDPDDVSAGPTDIADQYVGIEVSEDIPPTGQDCGAGSTCDLQQLASFDADQWRLGIIELPGGRGTVEEDPTVGGRYRIRVMWDDDIRANANTKGCPTDDPAHPTPKTCVEIWAQP